MLSDPSGVNIASADGIGVYADTYASNWEWGFYTPDKIYAGVSLTTRSLVTVARYAGDSILESGDIVSIAQDAPDPEFDTGSKPAFLLTRANGSNSHGVFGVVEHRIEKVDVVEETPDGSESMHQIVYSSKEPIKPGDLFSVIYSGEATVKIHPDLDVTPGQRLTVDENGLARTLRTVNLNGIELAENAGIFGKSLTHSDGSGELRVFVNCR